MIHNSLEDNWNKMYELACIYFNENGHLSLTEKSPLYYWLVNNRKVKENNLLSEERKIKLENIGICWNPTKDLWNIQFEKVKFYFELYGHLNFKPHTPMSNWILSNKRSKKKNTLSEERKNKLESIGIRWIPYQKKWNERFEEARAFYKINGHLNFKYRTTLSNWIKLNQRNKRINKLIKERIDLLNSIGMNWKDNTKI